MNAFDEVLHSELHSLPPSNEANLQELQRSYSSSLSMLSAALDLQDAIMKHMKRISAIEGDMCTDDIANPSMTDAVMHNLHTHRRGYEWAKLADALQVPAHVVNKLIRHFQEQRSTPERLSLR